MRSELNRGASVVCDDSTYRAVWFSSPGVARRKNNLGSGLGTGLRKYFCPIRFACLRSLPHTYFTHPVASEMFPPSSGSTPAAAAGLTAPHERTAQAAAGLTLYPTRTATKSFTLWVLVHLMPLRRMLAPNGSPCSPPRTCRHASQPPRSRDLTRYSRARVDRIKQYLRVFPSSVDVVCPTKRLSKQFV